MSTTPRQEQRRKLFGNLAAGVLVLCGIFSIVIVLANREKSAPKHATAEVEKSAVLPTTRPVLDEKNTPSALDKPSLRTRRKGLRPPRAFRFDGSVLSYEDPAESDNDNFFRQIRFENGDVVERYSGQELQSAATSQKAEDNRIWLDMRMPLESTSRFKLYGISTVNLGDTDAKTLEDYTQNYGIGGGIGVTYKISENAELNFDFRHTKTLRNEGNENDPNTSSAGISLKLEF